MQMMQTEQRKCEVQIGLMEHMIYVGKQPALRGKSALVQSHQPYGVIAQFDDANTGYGHGWYLFKSTEFVSREIFNTEYNKLKNTHNYSDNAAKRKALERLQT
jgi:hypothetical protein